MTSSCKTRVWFTRSTDGGATWSTPNMLNNQSGKNDQAFPRIAVDETDGSLMVVYYDTVNDAARLKTELFVQTSQDDGLTWTSASKVSQGQTDETASSADSGNQYGDYIGLHGHAGTFFPAWTDRRNGASEEIWSAKLSVVTQGATFLVERSTIGQDEVDARRGTAGGPRIASAFRLVVDGFTAAELGLTSATDTVAVTGSIAGMNVIGTGNSSTSGNYGPAVQRFTFQYMLDFGPDDTAFGFTTDTRMVPLAATVGGVTATGGDRADQTAEPVHAARRPAVAEHRPPGVPGPCGHQPVRGDDGCRRDRGPDVHPDGDRQPQRRHRRG